MVKRPREQDRGTPFIQQDPRKLKAQPPATNLPLAPPDSRAQQISSIALGLLGIAAWIAIGTGRGIGIERWVLIAAAAACAAIPAVSRSIGAALRRISAPSNWSASRAAIIIAIVAAGYFVLTAFNQDRDLFPKTHDDCSYVIGMQMLARGRLWMPGLALPDFFDAFYILVRPVYCSLYFPGTALLYVVAIWLHLPLWLLPALASGAVVGLTYRILVELIDGAAAALGALILISLSWFRVYSVLVTSHIPMLLLGLLLVWAWLRWRAGHRHCWAAAMGVLAGWAAITRPADAVVYALPVGVMVLWEIARRRPPRWTSAIAIMLLSAAPFLALQIVFDIGVTGHALRAPYGFYLERDQPGSSYGFHSYKEAMQPRSTLSEKREFYDRWVRPYLRGHTPAHLPALWGRRYLPMLVDTTMQCRLLLLFVPIGLLALRNRGRTIVFSTLPLFLLVYAFNPFFLEHYALLVIPAVVMLIVLGVRSLASAWPRFGETLLAMSAAAIVMISLTSFWEINRLISSPQTAVSDETFHSPFLRFVNTELPRHLDVPAAVLFRYHSGHFFEEPVYNWDVAWPDNAPIIRAHDLGEARDRELFAYYARTQPDRTIYRCDFDPAKVTDPQGPLKLDRLGTARELARMK